MKKILKTISALLIVSAIIMCSAFVGMSQAFAEEPGDITVTYYVGENQWGEPSVFAGGTGVIKTDTPTKSGRVFLYWVMKDAAVSAHYNPGQGYTFNENVDLYAVFGEKADGSDGIEMVKDGNREFEFKYNGEYQSVTFDIRQSNNDYTQEKLNDAYGHFFKFDELELYISTGEWFVKIDSLQIGGTEAGTYAASSSGQEWCQVTYFFGALDVLFEPVEDKYVAITPGVVKIYYEITYDANGGVGEFDPEKAYQNSATLTDQVPTKEGMTFKGWATSRNATEAEYQPGEQISLDDNLELYAVWQAPNPVTGIDSIIPAWFAAAVALAVVFIVIPGIRRRLA